MSRAGRDPDQLRGPLPHDVAARGVPLDDAEDQAHGRAVGWRHPLTGRQAEPRQAAAEEGRHRISTTTHRLGQRAGARLLAASGLHLFDILRVKLLHITDHCTSVFSRFPTLYQTFFNKAQLYPDF